MKIALFVFWFIVMLMSGTSLTDSPNMQHFLISISLFAVSATLAFSYIIQLKD